MRLAKKVPEEPTALEKSYGTMRSIPEYSKKTAYFMEEILPLVDKHKFDNTDKELFVTAIRVHANDVYRGILSVFKVPAAPTIEFGGGEAVEEGEEGEAAEEGEAGEIGEVKITKESRKDIANSLAVSKSIIQ